MSQEFEIGNKVQGGSAVVMEVTDKWWQDDQGRYLYILNNVKELWHTGNVFALAKQKK